MKRRRGVTLIELIVASTLLALLTGALFMGWDTGARSWLTASRKTERLSRLQLALRQIEKGLESSANQGLAFQNAPGIIAFPMAYPLKSTSGIGFVYQPGTSSPQWQKYAVFYFDGASRTLRTREVTIPVANPAATTTTPLTTFDDGSGVKPLSSYATGGAAVAEEIDTMTILAGTQSVEIVVNSSIPQGGAGAGNLTLHSTTVLRN